MKNVYKWTTCFHDGRTIESGYFGVAGTNGRQHSCSSYFYGKTIDSTAVTAQDNTFQNDIAEIESTIKSLEEKGKELYADEIASLKKKRDALVAEIEVGGKEVEDDAKAVLATVEPYRCWITTIAVAYLVIRVLLSWKQSSFVNKDSGIGLVKYRF